MTTRQGLRGLPLRHDERSFDSFCGTSTDATSLFCAVRKPLGAQLSDTCASP